MICYDDVIIGSGPGGAIVAHQLGEHKRNTLLIEEGPRAPIHTHTPFSMDEITRLYRNQGMGMSIGPPHINIAEGRCLGGGSEINSGLYHRLPDGIRDLWQKKYQIQSFSASDLLPYYESIETALSIHSPDTPHSLAALKLKSGADQLGWYCPEIPRWIKNGVRQSMSETYISGYEERGGAVMDQTRVVRLRHVSGLWEVICHGNTGEQVIRSNTVFVAGGAIQTPLLLRRSGISNHVGTTFGLHPSIKIMAEYDDPVSQLGDGVGRFQVKEFSPSMSFGSSVSTPAQIAQGLSAYGIPASFKTEWNRFAIYYAMICTPTMGTVRSLYHDPTPIIRYRLSPQDLVQLGLAFDRLCSLLWASGAKRLYPSLPVSSPLTIHSNVNSIKEGIEKGKLHLMSIHLFGSCPMGENRSHCAVNSFGKVYGCDGLYVSDGSLLGGSPSVNPQGIIMAIAKRNVSEYAHQKGLLG